MKTEPPIQFQNQQQMPPVLQKVTPAANLQAHDETSSEESSDDDEMGNGAE